ncbi:MAG: glycosyltransferase family 4 protein [Acidimicrobiales bacterium]
MSNQLVVAINTLSVSDANEGIRTMLGRLIPAFAMLERHRVLLVCSDRNTHLFEEIGGHVETVQVRLSSRVTLPARLFADQVTVPRLVRDRADVLVTPSSVGSLRSPIPQVVIVPGHLAVPSLRRAAGPKAMSTLHRLYYGPLLRLTLRRADAVAAISHHLAAALIDELGLDPLTTSAMPLGVDLPPHQPLSLAERAPVVLFVGTLYPYKDASVAVRGFAGARQALPRATRLVIVGRDPDGGQADVLWKVAAAEGVTDAVEVLGAVDEPTLIDLYRRSRVLVLPSRCEGFGLPVLEAMAHGTPTVVADSSSLPEVVGATGAIFAPGDVDGLASKLVDVFANDEHWIKLSRAARARAEVCTWTRSAEHLAAVVDRVAP